MGPIDGTLIDAAIPGQSKQWNNEKLLHIPQIFRMGV